MSGRGGQAVLMFSLPLLLSALLVTHHLLVKVDFHACFENFSASNGERPYLRVAEMSFGQLAYAAALMLDRSDILLAILGILPLSPFLIAWTMSRDKLSRKLWIVSAVIALTAITLWIYTTSLTSWHDCDLNGISLAVGLAPLLYTAMAFVATVVLAAIGLLFLRGTGQD